MKKLHIIANTILSATIFAHAYGTSPEVMEINALVKRIESVLKQQMMGDMKQCVLTHYEMLSKNPTSTNAAPALERCLEAYKGAQNSPVEVKDIASKALLEVKAGIKNNIAEVSEECAGLSADLQKEYYNTIAKLTREMTVFEENAQKKSLSLQKKQDMLTEEESTLKAQNKAKFEEIMNRSGEAMNAWQEKVEKERAQTTAKK